MNRQIRIVIPGRAEDVVNYVVVLERLGAEVTVTMEVVCPDGFDGLVIPGGGDIDPARYGQPVAGARGMDPQMDELQFGELDAFVKAGKPVLGICNGMQMINIYFGGDLIQDLESSARHQKDQQNNRDSFHMAVATPGGWMEQLYGKSFMVNSAHHQGAGRIGKDLDVVLVSDDGVTEGLVHRTLPVYGVQWHPERLDEARIGALQLKPDEEHPVKGEAVYAYFLKVCGSAGENS